MVHTNKLAVRKQKKKRRMGCPYTGTERKSRTETDSAVKRRKCTFWQALPIFSLPAQWKTKKKRRTCDYHYYIAITTARIVNIFHSPEEKNDHTQSPSRRGENFSKLTSSSSRTAQAPANLAINNSIHVARAVQRSNWTIVNRQGTTHKSGKLWTCVIVCVVGDCGTLAQTGNARVKKRRGKNDTPMTTYRKKVKSRKKRIPQSANHHRPSPSSSLVNTNEEEEGMSKKRHKEKRI